MENLGAGNPRFVGADSWRAGVGGAMSWKRGAWMEFGHVCGGRAMGVGGERDIEKVR